MLDKSKYEDSMLYHYLTNLIILLEHLSTNFFYCKECLNIKIKKFIEFISVFENKFV